nr:hypothetical protein [uncultured Nitrososphaera sp.]
MSAYYIKYPNNKSDKVSVVRKKPTSGGKKYGFAEGPFHTIKSVITRLNHMRVPDVQRPKKFINASIAYIVKSKRRRSGKRRKRGGRRKGRK